MIPELEKMRSQPAGQVSGGQRNIIARYGNSLRTLKSSRPDISILISQSKSTLLALFTDRTFVIEHGDLSEQGNAPKAS